MNNTDVKTLALQYAKPRFLRSLWEYLVTWFLLIVNSFVLYKLISFPFYLIAPFILLQGFILIRIFILQHDCGHLTLFKKRAINHFLGLICNLVTPIPFFYWKKSHAIHHKDSGNLSRRPWRGDIVLLLVEEFNKLNLFEKICYRVSRNFIIIIFFGWLYHIYWHRIAPYHKLGDPSRKKDILIIYSYNIFQLSLFFFILHETSVRFLLFGILCPWFISYSLGIYLFYIQHNFISSYFYTDEEMQQQGLNRIFIRSAFENSSCFLLPHLFRWFTGNIGYHHIHHLCPKIPFYNLKKIYDAHPLFKNVPTITLKQSLKQFSYLLYDLDSHKMLTWREYKNRPTTLRDANLSP